MKYLCHGVEGKDSWESSFDRSLGDCSLVCRHWAANIRPVIFARVYLKSQLSAKQFSTALSSPSSCKVPAPLSTLVRELNLDIGVDVRPLIYLIWSPVRNRLLPKLEKMRINYPKVYSATPSHSSLPRDCIYNLKLPRMIPSHQIVGTFRLSRVELHDILFRSTNALLYFLTSFNAECVYCKSLEWPSQPKWPEMHALSLGPFVPTEIHVCKGTAAYPLVWTMVTTLPTGPHPQQQRAYVSPNQIHSVAGILSLFSDGQFRNWVRYHVFEQSEHKVHIYTGIFY